MRKYVYLICCLVFLFIGCELKHKDKDSSKKNNDSPAVLNKTEKDEIYEGYLSILAQGKDLNYIDEEGSLRGWEGTPLTMATNDGYIDIVEEFLSKGADINGYDGLGSTPLLIAIENCNIDMVELLVNKGADVNKREYEEDENIYNDHEEKFYGRKAPLHKAIQTGSKQMVQLLIENGADVNSKYDYDGSALNDARLRAEDKGIVKMLINAGAQASIYDYTFIGDIEEVKKCLSNDENIINKEDVVGYTALHVAALEGYEEIANLLIIKGADINAQDISGDTPLMYAVMHSHKKVVELLLDNNADIDLKNYYGKTALLISIEINNKEIQKMIMDNERR